MDSGMCMCCGELVLWRVGGAGGVESVGDGWSGELDGRVLYRM